MTSITTIIVILIRVVEILLIIALTIQTTMLFIGTSIHTKPKASVGP